MSSVSVVRGAPSREIIPACLAIAAILIGLPVDEEAKAIGRRLLDAVEAAAVEIPGDARGCRTGQGSSRTASRRGVTSGLRFPCRDARPYSTSISSASIAAPNVLPCASVRSDTVPPPPRAPCSRKFSAPEIRQFEALDLALHHRAEMPLDTLRRHFARQHRVILLAQRDHADIHVSPLSPDRVCAIRDKGTFISVFSHGGEIAAVQTQGHPLRHCLCEPPGR